MGPFFSKFNSPPFYVSASVLVSLTGLCNGFDNGSIGAVTALPQFEATVGHLSPFLLGFTVSLVMLTAAIPAIFAGYLADKLGRLRLIFFGAVLYCIGALLQGTAFGLGQFMVGRAFGGFGQGVILGNASVYICEIAPWKHRGALAGLPQFMSTFGVCLGYFTCYGSARIAGSMSWRTPYVIQIGIGAVLSIGALYLPESPRWLALKDRRGDALISIGRLQVGDEEARDFLGRECEEGKQNLGLWKSMQLLFKREYRRRIMLALFILGMVQLSGIDAIIFYAPILFKQAGLPSSTSTFLASGLSSILMLLISIPATLLIDRWGRRTCTITGGLLLSGCMMLMGSLYAADAVKSTGGARWVVIVSVFVFGMTYCSTWGIVGKIYATEIQRSDIRAGANSVSQGLNFFTNWIVAILTPILLDKSAFGAYFLFGGLALITVAVLAAYMPETRGKTLEGIQLAFDKPPATASRAGSLLRMRRWKTKPIHHGVVESRPLAESDGVFAASSSVVESIPSLRVDASV